MKTLHVPFYLVANKKLSDSVAASLARAIMDARRDLIGAYPLVAQISEPDTDKTDSDNDTYLPVHPGAAAYFGGTVQSFFDKYGDDIFYGMLIFPVFGSAIAGVASYLRADSRTRRLRLLQKVLDLVRKVHAAQTIEAIEHLQIEADNLVIAIIHLSEHEEFDESVRMSFSFALDQLRFAIAARRTAILDRVGSGSAAAAA